MKKLFYSLFMLLFITTGSAYAGVPAGGSESTGDEPLFSGAQFSCGDGYVLVDHSKIDGIKTQECVKLWCRDLENGKSMGNGNSAASGYRATREPVELSDDKNNTIKCFGDRKWCSGEAAGVWNPEFGGYMSMAQP